MPKSCLMNTPVSATPTAPRAVLFDLDGTLADSAPDLADALNRMRREQGLPAIAEHLTRPQTSSGARGLLKVGFDITPEHAQYDAMKTQFLDYYEQGLAQRTRLFDGIATLLDQLDQQRIVWGIVTNKAQRFTGAVVEALGLHQRAACVVSGDTTPHAKPHPAPLLHAAQHIGIAAAHCLYVGDDLRDIQAANAAGMRGVAVRWGYLGDGLPPEQWGADALIDQPQQLLALLDQPANRSNAR
jgi:phosphoglycolate phosphatase